MRWWLAVGCIALGASAEADRPRGTRWQEASAPPLSRVWGRGAVFYGVGSPGSYRSLDGGATWTIADGRMPANGVWGSGLDDVWVVRARSLHHTVDGKQWTVKPLPGLSFGAAMEGMWGIGEDRYLFGVDRSDGEPRGTILRSRDRGASWQRETLPVEVARIASVWGSAADEVYAVGAGGVVLKSAGEGAWHVVRPGSGAAGLEAVWGTSAKAVYAVGANGAIVFSGDRGKTWVTRSSGVRYPLTSISGAGNEIFVGSAEGAPLRSADGVTWRPLTALVARGNVWANDRDRVVVAATSGVQFLGDAPPLETPILPVAAGVRVADTLLTARGQLAKYKGQPNAVKLLELALHEIDPQGSSQPPQETRPGELVIEIGAIKNCSSTMDRPRSGLTTGRKGTLDLRCTSPCDPSGGTSVEVTGDVPDGGYVRTDFVAPAGWCGPDPFVVDALRDDVDRVYQRRLDAALSTARKRIDGDASLIDAYAKYALDGGTRREHFFELARALSRPVWWRGFFWTHRSKSTPGHMCHHEMAAAEADGDRRAAAGDDSGAWHSYERVAHCDARLVIKAIHLACRTKRLVEAAQMIDHVPSNMKQKLIDGCLKDGVDLRPKP